MADGESIEKLKDLIRDKGKEGKVVFYTVEGLAVADIDELIKQPIDGLLYDLNRLPEVIMSNFDKRSVNDYAMMMVLKRLKEMVDDAIIES